ncbi:MAG: hypothetical protein Q8N17_26090 [Burkholderiaceae bacterium]|nr:hypothetical protein [Burkholderiaceae bacterium]
MSGSITDVLALAEAINARKTSDDRFGELLGEISTALAEILAAMEKPESKKDEQAEAEAMGKALAAALVVGLKNMPQPTLKVDMPAIKFPEAQTAWKSLDISLKRGPTGSVESMSLKRIA